MIDTSFLGQLDKFNLIIQKRVTSNYAGTKKSIATGFGLSIKDFKQYSMGDDFRLVDWKIYARSDHLYIKRFEEERSLVTHVLVDYSASMNYGKKIRKYEYGAMLALGFAYLSMKENEKFKFSTFSEELNVFRPKKGTKQLISMLDYLNKLKTQKKTRFEEVVAQYKKTIHSKSLVIIISDFLFDPEEIRLALLRLDGHEVKLIQVLDKSEVDIDVEGDMKLKDAEEDFTIRTFISRKSIEGYKKKLQHHNDKIKNICNHMKAEFYTVTTDKPIFDSFYQILRR